MSTASLEAPSHQGLSRRNFALGLVNGALFIMMIAFIDPDTIIPGFAWQLTGGNTLLIGTLVSIINTGWYWPTLVLTPALATRERLMPWYHLSAFARIASLFALAIVAWHLHWFSLPVGFLLITLMYLCYTSAGGLSMVPFMSVVSDSIPPNWRGRFFGARYLVGGLLALGAGVWVKWVLSDRSGYTFPDNYALLFTAGAIVSVPSLVSFCFAEEPAHSAQRRRLSATTELLRGLRIVRRDPNFRRLVVARSLSAFMLGLTLPFIVPYSLSRLNIAAAAVGLFMISKIITYSLSNLLWSRVSDYHGNRRLLLLSAFLAIIALAMVLTVHLLPSVPLFDLGGLHVTLQLVWVCLIFACFGFSNAGQEIGYTNFLLELIPERKRSTYLAIYYAFIAPLCWVPLLGAALIGNSGRFMLGFIIATVLALVMVRYTLRLREVRDFEEWSGLDSPTS